MSRTLIRVGRVYDKPQATDGTRVLVDLLWPRGLRKDDAHLDQWCTAVAPSRALRTWYGHVPERFDEPERAHALRQMQERAEQGPLTLLTATKHVEISHAAVLRGLITRLPDGRP